MSDRQPETSPAPNVVNVRGVLWGGAAIAIGIMIVVLAAWLLWQRWGALSGAQTYGGPNAGNVPQVSPPALQSAPRQERAQYEAQKRKLLESWEWIDQQRGIARIPVEEAMRIMANPNQGQNGKSADVRKESP